jgi:hypothetical protein
MSEARLTPGIEVSALLARAQAEGGFGAVLRKGDPDRGAMVVLLLQRGKPMQLLQRVLQITGNYGWEGREVSESEGLQQHLAVLLRNDPDLWLLELDIPSTERFIAEMT